MSDHRDELITVLAELLRGGFQLGGAFVDALVQFRVESLQRFVRLFETAVHHLERRQCLDEKLRLTGPVELPRRCRLLRYQLLDGTEVQVHEVQDAQPGFEGAMTEAVGEVYGIGLVPRQTVRQRPLIGEGQLLGRVHVYAPLYLTTSTSASSVRRQYSPSMWRAMRSAGDDMRDSRSSAKEWTIPSVARSRMSPGRN